MEFRKTSFLYKLDVRRLNNACSIYKWLKLVKAQSSNYPNEYPLRVLGRQ